MRRACRDVGGAVLPVLLAFLLLAPRPGRAQVPTTVGYQGSLTDAAGAGLRRALPFCARRRSADVAD